MLPPRASHLARRRSRQNRKLFLNEPLVPHFINTATFATRDFWPRRGASDAHTLQGSVRSEQRRRGQKEPSPGGLRRFSVTAPLRGMLPRSGAVTEEQRSQNRKATQPSGRRFILAPTSLLTPYRPLKGMRVARASSGPKIPRRKRGRIYEMGY